MSHPPLFKRLHDTTAKLLVHGQGILRFKQTDQSPCIFYLYSSDVFVAESPVLKDGLCIQFTEESVLVTRLSTKEVYQDLTNHKGLITNPGATYWFSLDAQNLQLRAGIGEARVETMIYDYTLTGDHKQNKMFLESLSSYRVAPESTGLVPFRLIRDPVTYRIPMEIKPMEELTMDQLALQSVLPSAALSAVAQQLYHGIAGKSFVLDTDDFPDFVQAIEYSIKTPTGWCYQKLRDKSTEFSKDKPNLEETYLRITLGQNNGESPGIPYVMEIWPVGHYSPVHNHSEAHAIIRVLQGEIQVSQFPFLCPTGVDPFVVNTFHKDQITWISPMLNQTHQLRNRKENMSTCITIQCYMYDGQDRGHYDYFDYVDANGVIQQYEPDSDMDFVDFKRLMKEEWDNRVIPTTCFSCFHRV
jgi:hypothetical protein